MIYCAHCRAMLAEGTQVCGRCGEPTAGVYKSVLEQEKDRMWWYALVIPIAFAAMGSLFGKYFAVLGFIVGWFFLSIV